MINHAAEKNLSYDRRVVAGQTVTLNRDVTRGGDLFAPKGAKVVVASESNAGFRGIEFSFIYGGDRFCGVSTGVIAKLSDHPVFAAFSVEGKAALDANEARS